MKNKGIKKKNNNSKALVKKPKTDPKIQLIKKNAIIDLLKMETHPTIAQTRTFGQKAADGLTKIAGSWYFIIIFLIFIFAWMTTSGYFALKYFNQIDEYPFIILNLILSCLAAIQAPIILMSQNRESQKDRLRSEYDYAVNRKSFKEVAEMKKTLERIERKIK